MEKRRNRGFYLWHYYFYNSAKSLLQPRQIKKEHQSTHDMVFKFA